MPATAADLALDLQPSRHVDQLHVAWHIAEREAIKAAVAAIAGNVYRLGAAGSSADNADAADAVITQANVTGAMIVLGEGTHIFSHSLKPFENGASIYNAGGAKIQLRSDYSTGPLITLVGRNCKVIGLRVQGGGNASSCLTNPDLGSTDSSTGVYTPGTLIALGLGASSSLVTDLHCTAVNGYLVESLGANVGAPYLSVFTNIRGNYNGGGIHLEGISTSNYGAQVMIDDINLQVCQRFSILKFKDCNDVQIGKLNGAVSGDIFGAYPLHILGISSTITIEALNFGSIAIPGCEPIVLIEGSPNNIWINGGVAQGGANGVRVLGGNNLHLRFQISRSGGVGALILGGSNIFLTEATFTRNGRVPARVITDLVTTSGSTAASSPAQAAWTLADQYRILVAPGVVAGTWIAGVAADGKSITLSGPATVSATGVTATVGVHAEVAVLTDTANVFITGCPMETPTGTGAEQVPNVLRVLPGSANRVIFRNNPILGGHVKADVFVGGQPKMAKENLNFNPYGPLPVPTLPAGTGANTSGTAWDRTWYLTAGTAPCTVQVKNTGSPNGAQNIVIPPGQLVPVLQPAGSVLGFTYTGAAGAAGAAGDATAPTCSSLVGL